MARVCTVEGCVRPHNARGYCGMHYRTWKRHGDPLVRVKVRNTCSIKDCNDNARGHGYCQVHYTRWRKHGDPSIVLPNPGNRQMATGRITYDGAHRRVYRAKGKASSYTCRCGKQAAEWAYDHGDPDEWTAERAFMGRVLTVAYSGDPSHYVPMCRRCHVDQAHPTR